MKTVIEITKDVMVEGEELNDTITKVFRAVRSAGTAKERILSVSGIYKDHVVVRDAEDGTYFRMPMQRSDKGLSLGEPEPGRMVFVADTSAAKADGEDGAGGEDDGMVTYKCPNCGHTQEAKADAGEVKCEKCQTAMDAQEKMAKNDYKLVTLPPLTVAVGRDGLVLGSDLMVASVAKALNHSEAPPMRIEVEVDKGFWGGLITS